MASDRATREAAEVLGLIHFGAATVGPDTVIVADAIDAAEARGREQVALAIDALLDGEDGETIEGRRIVATIERCTKVAREAR